MAADFCQDLLTDKAALETMAKENPTGFQALVEWVKDFLAKVKEKLTGKPANSEELQIYRAMEQSLKDAFGEAWAKGITGAVQTHDTVGSLAEANKNTAQENLGHATASFTLATYAHATLGMKRESSNRMDAFIRSLRESGENHAPVS